MIKKNLVDPEMGQMFNQMLGEGDPAIVNEKFTNIKKNLTLVAQVLDNFSTGPLRQFSTYKTWLDEIKVFGDKVATLKDLESYKQVKEHNITKQVINICKEFIPYHTRLDTEKWVHDHPGLVFEIFAFSKFDIKYVWNDASTTPAVKTYLLKLISLLYKNCYAIYKITSSPDVDVKRFSEIIISSIEKIKHLPELHRCKRAFKKIEESVQLLESNFEEYHKDMVESNNPNTIMESFIVDVSKNQKMDPTLMKEFKTIINFYQKQSQGKIKDPRYAKMLSSINSKIDMFEKSAQNQKQTDIQESSSSSDSDTDTP